MPYLAAHVKTTFSQVLVQNAPPSNNNRSLPSSQPPQQPTFDPSTLFDHPGFQSFLAIQQHTSDTLVKLNQKLDDQKAATDNLGTMMQHMQQVSAQQQQQTHTFLSQMFSIISPTLPESARGALDNLNAQLVRPEVQLINAPQPSLSSMEGVSSSGKRGHPSDSSEGDVDNSKKVAVQTEEQPAVFEPASKDSKADTSLEQMVADSNGGKADLSKTDPPPPPLSPRGRGPVHGRLGIRGTDNQESTTKPSKSSIPKPPVPRDKPRFTRGGPAGRTPKS